MHLNLTVLATGALFAPAVAQGTITANNVTYSTYALTPTQNDSPSADFTADASVDTDVVFEHGFYYRVDNDTDENALKDDGTFTQSYSGPHADLDWADLDNRGLLSLQIDMDAVSTGPTSGFVVFVSTFTNISPNQVTVNYYSYIDMDCCGIQNSATGNGLTQSVTSSTCAGEVFEFRAPNADRWCVANFAVDECGIRDGAVTTLPDGTLPFGPGDYSGAVQWEDRMLAAGASTTFVVFLDHNPGGSGCSGRNATSSNYGTGSSGQFGVPRIGTLALPRLNSTATIAVGNGLSNGAGQLLMGLTRTSNTIGNVTLLNEGLVAVGFSTDVVGSSSTDFAIPNDRNLCGQKLYLQAFFIDPSVQGAFPISHSDGVEWTFGN